MALAYHTGAAARLRWRRSRWRRRRRRQLHGRRIHGVRRPPGAHARVHGRRRRASYHAANSPAARIRGDVPRNASHVSVNYSVRQLLNVAVTALKILSRTRSTVSQGPRTTERPAEQRRRKTRAHGLPPPPCYDSPRPLITRPLRHVLSATHFSVSFGHGNLGIAVRYGPVAADTTAPTSCRKSPGQISIRNHLQ